MAFGSSLAGFASGLNNGLQLGGRLNDLIQEDKLQRVREQGIAEAKAMQAKAMPQITDNGDMQNLTANPQHSMDPRAAQQPQPGAAALGLLQQNQAAGIPQAAPAQQPMNDLSSVPQASQAPTQQPFESASPMAGGVRLAAPKRFDVGGKQFDDKKAADAYAKSQAPAIEEFYSTTLVPRMTEALTTQGRLKEAEAWQKYAEDDKSKRNMATWGQAFQFAQIGDYNQAAQRLMKLHPDFDDGYELVSSKPTKGPDGSDGFTMKLRDEDGNEQEVFHDARTITEVGLQQLSPIEMFSQRFKRQTQADTLSAREAIDARNDRRTAERTIGAVNIREQGQNNRLSTKIEADKEKLDRVETGKDNRFSQGETGKDSRLERAAVLRTEENARKVAKTIKKSDDPEKQYMTARRQVMLNPMSATMEAGEIDQEVRKVLSAAQGFANEKGAPASAPGGTVDNPFSGSTSAKPKGVPVFRNGQIQYIDR